MLFAFLAIVFGVFILRQVGIGTNANFPLPFVKTPREKYDERGKASEPYVLAHGDCGGQWLRDMAWTVDGAYLVAATTGGVQVLSIKGRALALEKTIRGEAEPYRVAVDPKGRWVAVGVWYGTTAKGPLYPCYVDVWDVRTWAHIRRLAEPDRSIFDLVFSPDGEHLAALSGTTSLLVWNTKAWELECARTGYSYLYELVVSPSGGLFFRDDDTDRSWWCDTFTAEPVVATNRVLAFLASDHEAITVSTEGLERDGYRFLAALERRELGPQPRRLEWTPCGSTVRLPTVGSSENVLAAVDMHPGFVCVWHLSGLEPIAYLAGLQLTPQAPCFHPNGKWFATGWGSGNIVIWDIEKLVADDNAGLLPSILKEEDPTHWGRQPVK